MDKITDKRLREIVDKTYCLLDEGESMARELLAARADLREAIELLRAHGQAPSWLLSAGKFGAVKDWNRRYGELLEKHKEDASKETADG